MMRWWVALAVFAGACGPSSSATPAPQERGGWDGSPEGGKEEKPMANGAKTEFAAMSEAEWRAKLTPEQYRVCREGGTESAGSGAYLDHFEKGTYACIACGAPLFSSDTKYESGCGWPAFYDAVPGTVQHRARLEVGCGRCGSHLGHVFDDGPPPTGKRY